MDRVSVIDSIVENISDYRKGEIKDITSEYVNKWVNQFDSCVQEIILYEMDYVIKNYYLSRKKAKDILRNFITDKDIFGKNPKEKLLKINFLDIERHGNSQKEMLKLVNEILVEEFNITISQCRGSNLFIYLDDCIYTGNTFRYDFENFFNNVFFNNITIITFHYAMYKDGYNYSINRIDNFIKNRNIKFINWCCFDYYNSKYNNKQPHIMWPKTNIYMEDIIETIVLFLERLKTILVDYRIWQQVTLYI